MRVFIAVPFDDKTKKSFAEVQKELIEGSISGKFTDWNNFHLTIKFIGEVTEEEIMKIDGTLSSIAKAHHSFTLQIGGLDGFTRGQTIIPWLAVKRGKEKIFALNNDVEEALYEQGLPKESRPYQAHMTLGRKVRISNDSWSKIKHNREPFEVSVHVTSIVLMESTRQDGKLVYRILKEYPLSGKRMDSGHIRLF